MCVDYTNLNKTCPKDCFSLLRINQLLDSTSGHTLLSLTGTFSGYNHIKMVMQNEEHTSFVTDFDTYCYKMMLSVLKNANTTYQHLMTKVFKE